MHVSPLPGVDSQGLFNSHLCCILKTLCTSMQYEMQCTVSLYNNAYIAYILCMCICFPLTLFHSFSISFRSIQGRDSVHFPLFYGNYKIPLFFLYFVISILICFFLFITITQNTILRDKLIRG